VRFGGWVEPAPPCPASRHLAPRRRGQRQGLRHGDPRPRHRARQHAALWKARAGQIDLHAFNSGDYARAAEFKNQFENISWVLYPNDSTPAGRELRLRQEYFFTSASIQDILARHLAEHGTLTNLADKVAIHLNDTHPAIGVAELMRLLVDEHGWPGPPPGRSRSVCSATPTTR
jgi:starch phosphorylase